MSQTWKAFGPPYSENDTLTIIGTRSPCFPGYHHDWNCRLSFSHMIQDLAEQQDLAHLDAMGYALACVWSHPSAPGHLARALTSKLRQLPADDGRPTGLLQALAVHSGPLYFSSLQQAYDDARWLHFADLVSRALCIGVSVGADHVSRLTLMWADPDAALTPRSQLAARLLYCNQLPSLVELLDALSTLLQRMRPHVARRPAEELRLLLRRR